MTNEEAIKRIEEEVRFNDSLYHYNKKYLEAVDMAIKALEQTDGDLISRQAVIDSLYELCDTEETLKENPWRDNPHIDAVIETVEQLPSAKQAYGDLISRQAAIDIVEFECGEWTGLAKEINKQLKQLPSAEKTANVVEHTRWISVGERLPEYGESVLTVDLYDEYEINHIIDELGEWFYDGVVAWMPLPEPYKVESEEV